MSDKLNAIVSVEIDLDDVARDVGTGCHDKCLAFIMSIDNYASDYNFTERLIESLKSALAVEDAAVNGS